MTPVSGWVGRSTGVATALPLVAVNCDTAAGPKIKDGHLKSFIQGELIRSVFDN